MVTQAALKELQSFRRLQGRGLVQKRVSRAHAKAEEILSGRENEKRLEGVWVGDEDPNVRYTSKVRARDGPDEKQYSTYDPVVVTKKNGVIVRQEFGNYKSMSRDSGSKREVYKKSETTYDAVTGRLVDSKSYNITKSENKKGTKRADIYLKEHKKFKGDILTYELVQSYDDQKKTWSHEIDYIAGTRQDFRAPKERKPQYNATIAAAGLTQSEWAQMNPTARKKVAELAAGGTLRKAGEPAPTKTTTISPDDIVEIKDPTTGKKIVGTRAFVEKKARELKVKFGQEQLAAWEQQGVTRAADFFPRTTTTVVAPVPETVTSMAIAGIVQGKAPLPTIDFLGETGGKVSQLPGAYVADPQVRGELLFVPDPGTQKSYFPPRDLVGVYREAPQIPRSSYLQNLAGTQRARGKKGQAAFSTLGAFFGGGYELAISAIPTKQRPLAPLTFVGDVLVGTVLTIVEPRKAYRAFMERPAQSLGEMALLAGLGKFGPKVVAKAPAFISEAGTVGSSMFKSTRGSYRISPSGGRRVSPTKGKKPKSRIQMRKESFQQAYDPRVSFQGDQAILRVRTKGLKESFVKERVLKMKRTGEIKVFDVGLRTDIPSLKGSGTPQVKVRYQRSQALAGVGKDFSLGPTESMIFSRTRGKSRGRPAPKTKPIAPMIGGGDSQALLSVSQKKMVSQQVASRSVKKRVSRQRATFTDHPVQGSLGQMGAGQFDSLGKVLGPRGKPPLVLLEEQAVAPKGFRPGTYKRVYARLYEKKAALDAQRGILLEPKPFIESAPKPVVRTVPKVKPKPKTTIKPKATFIEKIGPKVSLVDVVKIGAGSALGLGVGLRSATALKLGQAQAQSQIVAPALAVDQRMGQLLAQDTAQDLLLKGATGLDLAGKLVPGRSGFKTPPKQITDLLKQPRRPPPRRPPRRPPKAPPPPPELKLPGRPSKKKRDRSFSMRSVDAWVAEVKKKGRWVIVSGKLQKGLALMRGEDVTKKTLAATFRVRKAGGKIAAKPIGGWIPSADVFRSYRLVKGKKVKLKDTYIQRRGKRLLTKGERSQIQTARKKGGMQWL